MLKSLLASAAALATLSVAHAADLPMTKAEPVEYVKICSEFGDGFYYIPGSDTCLSINGYVRADYWYFEPDSRADNGLEFGSRGRVNFDARTATEWGTLRSFLSLQYTYNGTSDSNAVSADKAFIQFGGWTAGYATSFYDFYDAEAGNTIYGTYFSSGKTTHLLAYTAVFGDGLAATLSVEDNYLRRSGIFNFLSVGANTYDVYGGQRAPDVVASLRWAQAWGSAQIMAAAHQTQAISDFPQIRESETKWGFAVGAGAIFNLPSGFFFALEGNYARGAAAYTGLGDSGYDKAKGSAVVGNDNDVVDLGTSNPGVFGANSSRVWSVTGDIGYNFTPSIVGHIVASYADYRAPYARDLSAFFGTTEYTSLPGLVDFKAWAVSGNFTYTIVKGLTVAGEISYENRNFDGLYFDNFAAATVDPNYDTWAAGMRLRRSF